MLTTRLKAVIYGEFDNILGNQVKYQFPEE